MNKHFKWSMLIAGWLGCLPAGLIFAVNLPSTANPAYVGQRATPEYMYKPSAVLPSPLIEEHSTLSTQTQVTFTLKRLTVVGATIFSNKELEQMFRSYIGKTISVADLQAMANKITAKYRRSGYIWSEAIVSAQNIKNGTAMIRVIEGKK